MIAARLAEKAYAEKLLHKSEEELAVINNFLADHKPEEIFRYIKDMNHGRRRLLSPLGEIDLWLDDE